MNTVMRKSSDAELASSINFIFRWYRNAASVMCTCQMFPIAVRIICFHDLHKQRLFEGVCGPLEAGQYKSSWLQNLSGSSPKKVHYLEIRYR